MIKTIRKVVSLTWLIDKKDAALTRIGHMTFAAENLEMEIQRLESAGHPAHKEKMKLAKMVAECKGALAIYDMIFDGTEDVRR